MDTDLWIHIIVFVSVFILVSIVLLRRAKTKDKELPNQNYEEIQAEVFETEKIVHQARQEIENARKAQNEAEELKRKTIEELEKAKDEIRFKKRDEKSKWCAKSSTE